MTDRHRHRAGLVAALLLAAVPPLVAARDASAQRRDGGVASTVVVAGATHPGAEPTSTPRAADAGALFASQPSADAGVPSAATSDAAAATPASTAGALDDPEPPTPAEDTAATRALGSESGDAPDPVAEEGERTGSAEGEAIPPRAAVSEEIAALSDRACLRALQRARVPFERVHHHVAGIAVPIRVTGPIHGVRYAASDRRDVHELMDCRLAVALVRFSRMLRRLGVVEVRHYSTYRPPDEHAVRRQPLQARHAGGLAIDAAWFNLQNGERYNVERDFHGRRGRPVCGPDARVPHNAGARLLRTVACDAGRLGLFHVILTPNYNYQHRNHFHLEVTRGASWRAVH